MSQKAECSACDLVALAQNIINWFIYAAGVAAVLMFAYAGIIYATSATNPEQIAKAHKIFWNVLLGMVFVLAAWLIIDTIMKALYRTESKFGPWNEILCARVGARIDPLDDTSVVGAVKTVSSSVKTQSGALIDERVAALNASFFGGEMESPFQLASASLPPKVPENATFEEGVKILSESTTVNKNEYAYAYVVKDGQGRWVALGELSSSGGLMSTEKLTEIHYSQPDKVTIIHTHPSAGFEMHPPSPLDITGAAGQAWADPQSRTSFGVIDRNGLWTYDVPKDSRFSQTFIGDLQSVVQDEPEGARVYHERNIELMQKGMDPYSAGEQTRKEAMSGQLGSSAKRLTERIFASPAADDFYRRYEGSRNKLESTNPTLQKEGGGELLKLYRDYGVNITPPPLSAKQI